MKNILFFKLTVLFIFFNSCSISSEELNIMSYNIRLDVESDGVNKWDNRKEGLISLIKEENPDVLGIQEGLPNQIKYLSKELEDYNMIGEGRDGGDNGEYSAIYYKSEKLRLEKAETFWLSETPDIPSIGWDAALNRIATLGVFRIKNSNENLIVYNSHFDHIGIQARVKSVSVILNHIKDNDFINNAIIVMGDLNTEPNDAPIKLLAENLEDSFNSFPIEKPFGTFSGFDLESKLLNRIDYIFTKNIEVIEYRHIQKRLPNKLWPSDHLPIFISIN